MCSDALNQTFIYINCNFSRRACSRLFAKVVTCVLQTNEHALADPHLGNISKLSTPVSNPVASK